MNKKEFPILKWLIYLQIKKKNSLTLRVEIEMFRIDPSYAYILPHQRNITICHWTDWMDKLLTKFTSGSTKLCWFVEVTMLINRLEKLRRISGLFHISPILILSARIINIFLKFTYNKKTPCNIIKAVVMTLIPCLYRKRGEGGTSKTTQDGYKLLISTSPFRAKVKSFYFVFLMASLV